MPVGSVDYAAHGIQRGGNHAVINWILRHFKSSVFYNCCSLEDDRAFVYDQDFIQRGEGPQEVALASFEDAPEIIDKAGDVLKRPVEILILRDFYNTYASRFEKRRRVKSIYWLERKWSLYDEVSMWKRLATRFLEGGDRFVKINYNMWFRSREYRKVLSGGFGKFSDEGVDSVSHFGGGSSFDHRDYDGRANEMDVLRRWVRYYGDGEYAKKILADEEAREINREIFGFSPPRLHL